MRALLLLLFIPSLLTGKTFDVGPNKHFQKIEDAIIQAKKGDSINVYPKRNNSSYLKVAIYVRTPGLTIRGMGKTPIKLSGDGFDYSGAGSVPRAIFQFNKGADNCLVENFDLSGASNKSHNGAAFRINQANNVTIRSCIIHNNDMGIMSNGDGSAQAAQNQIIEFCHIHSNGNSKDPGFNHNLYLGGASVTVRFCEINNSLTGHNVKSRAHFNRIAYNYIHDSANREFDLVDGKDTTFANSHSLLIGNLIIKNPKCQGNRGTVHFGQDGGKAHNGKLYLIHNTVISPFISPIILIDHEQAGLVAKGNIFHDNLSGQNNMTFIHLAKGTKESALSGSNNYFSKGFRQIPKPFTENKLNTILKFKNAKKLDFRLSSRLSNTENIKLSSLPLGPGMKADRIFWQYSHPMKKVKRPKQIKLSLGAVD